MRVPRQWIRCLTILLHSPSGQEWRAPLALSLAFSVGIMGVVLAVGLGSRQADASLLLIEAGRAAPQTGGASVMSVSRELVGRNGWAPGLFPSGVEVVRHQGPCLPCPEPYPPGYVAESGYFVVTIPDSLLGKNIYFGRPPASGGHVEKIGSFDVTTFYFYLNPDKKCGDFILFADGPDGVPVEVARFLIHCDEFWGDFWAGLAGWSSSDPLTRLNVVLQLIYGPGIYSKSTGTPQITDRSSGYSLVSMSPGHQVAASNVITFELHNPSATWMYMELLVPEAGATLPISPSLRLGAPPAPQWVAPGDTAMMPVGMELNWGQAPAASIAAPVLVTSTVVFSIGPNTQMTGTLIVTRPYQLYTPLVAREQSGAW